MALIFPGTLCPICNKGLDKPYTITSGVVFNPEHHLWPYCDAPLHFDCLETWPYRIEFSKAYFNAAIQHHKSGNGGYLLIEEKTWVLATGPCVIRGHPYYVEIRFSEWPLQLYSNWKEWDEFLSGKFRHGLTGNALNAAEQVIDIITKIAPDLSKLTHLLAQKTTSANG